MKDTMPRKHNVEAAIVTAKRQYENAYEVECAFCGWARPELMAQLEAETQRALTRYTALQLELKVLDKEFELHSIYERYHPPKEC